MKDPFDFPLSIIPRGMTYQWVGKTLMGEPHPDYKKMLDGGWIPVPGRRHPGIFKTINEEGFIEVGGQILMGRTTEATRQSLDKSHDLAFRNAGSGRTVLVTIDIPVHLSQRELELAISMNLSSNMYVINRLRMMEEGRDINCYLCVDVDRDYGSTGSFRFGHARRPRKQWLRKLFDLISTEN